MNSLIWYYSSVPFAVVIWFYVCFSCFSFILYLFYCICFCVNRANCSSAILMSCTIPRQHWLWYLKSRSFYHHLAYISYLKNCLHFDQGPFSFYDAHNARAWKPHQGREMEAYTMYIRIITVTGLWIMVRERGTYRIIGRANRRSGNARVST